MRAATRPAALPHRPRRPARPRPRASNELDGCYLYDIDDLEAVVAETLAGRRREAERAEAIVAAEAERFRAWQASLDVVPAIASLRARAEEIRAAELAQAELQRASERRAVESVTAQIVNKLLHLPTVRMKEAAAAAEARLRRRGAPPVRARGRAVATAARSTGRPLPLQAPTRVRPRPAAPGAPCGHDEAAACRAAVLVRVGSRGTRLALTQAEQRRRRLRGPGIEIALVPITTAGDRDRTRPFGEIGARGVFVKELEEALLEGRIDVAVHSAKDMTSTDTAGSRRRLPRARRPARRALRRGRAAAGDADRHRLRSSPAQLLALEPRCRSSRCAGTSTRGSASAASAASTRSSSLRAASSGSASVARSASASSPTSCCRRPGRARSRCRCARARRSSSRAADDAETRRRVEAERACVAVVGGGCLAPVAAHHDGATLTALVAAEDGRGSARAATTRSARPRARRARGAAENRHCTAQSRASRR